MQAGFNVLGFFVPNVNINASVPKSYIVYRFYDKNGVLLSRDFRLLSSASNGAWENLQIPTFEANTNGNLEVFVFNESNVNVWFDDMQIQHILTLISQENHYYAFGMNAKEIEKEGKPNDRFHFMGVEKESSFGLDWTETDHRSYDSEVGRFWQVDKLSEEFVSATPYNYAFNNPILLNDPEGLAPPNFEEFLKGLFASSKNGAVYSGDEVRSAFAKTQGLKEEETVSFAQGSNNNKSGIWVDIEGTKNSGLTARGKKSSFINEKEQEDAQSGDYFAISQTYSLSDWIFGARRVSGYAGREHYVDYNGFIIAPNCGWHLIAPDITEFVNPIGKIKSASKILSAHKNTNTSVGNFVIYRIMDASGNWLKYGKANADDVMKSQKHLDKNRRAHTSARLASKKYPNSTFHIVKELFNVTTEYAKSVEKRMVETARKYGQTLPLNRER